LMSNVLFEIQRGWIPSAGRVSYGTVTVVVSSTSNTGVALWTTLWNQLAFCRVTV